MSKHTTEPWIRGTDIDPAADAGHVMTQQGYAIADCILDYSSLEEAEQIANARRIVACVNACSGIDTVQLEMLDVVEALESLNSVRQQRDELLAAAKNLRNVKGRHHSEQAFNALVAAIKKAEYGSA